MALILSLWLRSQNLVSCIYRKRKGAIGVIQTLKLFQNVGSMIMILGLFLLAHSKEIGGCKDKTIPQCNASTNYEEKYELYLT